MTNNSKTSYACPILLAILLGFSFCANACGQQDSLFPRRVPDHQLQGYTEPFRSIELASDETGAISELSVAEGDYVQLDQVVARLDDRVQQIQVESAKFLAEARGRIDAAEQAVKRRQRIFDIISELEKTGSTSNSEIERAGMELNTARARLAEAKEEIFDRESAFKRSKVQLERRWIRAPFAGVISVIHREEGEFLSPLNPEILTLVKVDQLLVVFNLPSNRHASYPVGKLVLIKLSDGRKVEGVVHAVGIQTDAKSGTIPVKVKVDNTDGTIRSGEQCEMEF